VTMTKPDSTDDLFSSGNLGLRGTVGWGGPCE
jgi:hypothetical protein